MRKHLYDARARARERTTGMIETEIGNKTKLSYARRDRIPPRDRMLLLT